MRDLTQLNKLEEYLKEKGIEYQRFDNDDDKFGIDRHQICVPNAKNPKWDAICHYGSYGAKEGLLEIYGSIVDPMSGDSVEGHLTADDVIARIENRW